MRGIWGISTINGRIGHRKVGRGAADRISIGERGSITDILSFDTFLVEIIELGMKILEDQDKPLDSPLWPVSSPPSTRYR